jgi:hypothetical protein
MAIGAAITAGLVAARRPVVAEPDTGLGDIER